MNRVSGKTKIQSVSGLEVNVKNQASEKQVSS